MSTYSNWREDLIEVIDTPTTEKKAEKKIKEGKVKNTVVINPKLEEAVNELGGELLEVKEVDDKENKEGTNEDPQIKSKEKRQQMIKRQVLLKKLQAVRAGGGADITAGYEPEGDQLDERLGGKGYKSYTSLTGKKVSGDWEDSDRGAGNKAKKRAGGKVEKKSPTYLAHVHNKEGYEAKKTGEVLAAFKRDPKVRKRFEKAAKKEDGPGSVKNRAADSMLQTAKDTAKRKGDTSKSDDRYAYESAVLDANTKISNKEKRDKLEKELASLTKRAKAMKKHGSGYHPFLHGEEVEKVDEGIMKMVKKVVRSKKTEKKAEKAMDAGARAKRALARKVHAKYVSGSEDNVPDDIREGKGYQPEIEHSKLGDAKKKADKERESKLPPHLQGDAIGKMKKAFASEGEDKAFNFVVNKLKKKYGDGVLTKGDKIKPLTPEQKKKNAEIMAKRAKQDGRDATEKASDGRYSDRYSNRGSD